MDHGPIRADPDSDEVDSAGTDPGRERAHLASLGGVDGIDGITLAPGGGSHLDRDSGRPVDREKIDLTTTYLDVGRDHG